MASTKFKHFSRLQELEASFSVSGRGRCDVSFTVEPDTDPERHGLALLGLYNDINDIKGFPVVRGAVSSPESRTYGSIYGWVQIFSTSEDPWAMDHYPTFEGINSPFCIWGSEPTLVDAPTRLNLEKFDWTARSFLCYTPDVGMTKRVVPILAFEWGFLIEDHKPYVKELRQLDAACWNEHLEMFRGKYTEWTFDHVDEQHG